MRRIRITQNIEYLEPVGKRTLYACSGLALNGRVKVVVDANPGRNKTTDFLVEFDPDVALISHYHPDHSALVSQIIENTRAELFIPGEEEPYFRSLDHVVAHTMGDHSLQGRLRAFTEKLLTHREVEPFVAYDNPCSFVLGDVLLQCVRTPGHSPGHTSFYFPELKVLFTSDMGIDRIGPWYGWKDCSLEAIVESILRLRSLDVDLLLTSHGGIVARNIRQCWDRALMHILDRENRIMQGLDKGRTRDEIIGQGVCYAVEQAAHEPIRPFHILWDSFMYDHHARILDSGSLSSLFPALRPIRAACSRQ